jgi:MinD-like ATPase involved in chromosome partitioning or flagellar assembly
MEASLVLRRLAEARSRGIARSQRVSRAVRLLSLGVVRGGVAEAAELERLLIEAVRVPLHRRVVGVLAGTGGAGATTTAAGVATTLAALRDEPVVLLDGQAGSASLAGRVPGLGGHRTPAPTVWDVAVDGERAAPLLTPGGLGLVDAAPRRAGRERYLGRALDVLGEQHPLAVMDLGDDAAELAGLADRVLVVTTPAAAAVDGATRLLERLWRADPDRVAAVAVVCPHPSAHRRLVRRLHEELSADVARVVVVPYDAALRDGGAFEPARLRPATREAYLALAALATG